MKRITIIIAGVFTMATIVSSCKSSSEGTADSRRKGGGDKPSVKTIFKQMDANNDNKISKSEAKGPLAKDFSKIDKNNDGFISKDELKNAPKPERRQRPIN